ncbi:MAG: efflux RND transporter periplasmic adaptor subunit [Verrucomicrobiota bacterium]
MANPKPRKRKKKLITFSLIILVVAALGAVAIFKNKKVPITVQKEKVTRRNLTELVVANGKIQPVIQVKISPEVSGEIIALPVKEGQRVNKGDLLVKIKPDNYIASRNSSEANYQYSLTSSNTAAANLLKAELEYNRIKELYKNKLISDSAHQEARTLYEISKFTLAGALQQIQMAHSALQRAEDDLSKTTIYSPLTGTITKLNSQIGERVVGTAMMAGTEIMIVSDLNEMETRVDIGEIDVVLIEVGQNARLEVDPFKDKKFKGTVTEIANSAKTSGQPGAQQNNQDATKFEVKIRFAEKDAFRPGMSVTAEIETRLRTNVLTVPIQSVTTRLPKSTNNLSAKTNLVASTNITLTTTNSTNEVTVVKKKSGEAVKPIEVVFVVENGKVKMVPVKRGISDDNYFEITEGLQEGQEVVSGSYKAINRELEDGKEVVVGNAKPESAKEKE